MRQRIFLLGILVFVSCYELISQQSLSLYPYSRFQWGLYLNGGVSIQNANFQRLPDVPNCCPKFTRGYGFLSNVGLLVENPLSELFLYDVRLGFFYSTNTLDADEPFLYNVGGTLYNGTIRHTINTDFMAGSVEGNVGVRFLGNFIFKIGARADFNFVKKFSQKEELVSPSFGVFENNSRVRNEIRNQDIPNAYGVSFFGVGSVSTEYPLNKKRTLRLCPELSLSLPLNAIVKDYQWYQNILTLGVALKFSKEETYPLFADLSTTPSVAIETYKSCGDKEHFKFVPDTLVFQPMVQATAGIKKWEILVTNYDKVLISIKGDTSIVSEYKVVLSEDVEKYKDLSGELEVVFAVWDWDDKETETVKKITINRKTYNFVADLKLEKFDGKKDLVIDDTIRIEKTIATNLRPLLNYIFFDENSDQIAERYVKFRREDSKYFKINYLYNQSTMETYYQFLNLIGYRMRQYPTMNINIVGCVSGRGEEKNNLELARRRAENVRNYLVDVWDIDTSRMNIVVNSKTMGLPEIPSKPEGNEHLEEAAEENRRVEIVTTPENSTILSPVMTMDTILNANVSLLRFSPQVLSLFDIDFWELQIFRNQKLFYEFRGRDSLPAKLEYYINSRLLELQREEGDFEYRFYVANKEKQECTVLGKIPVKITTSDSILDKFILILFDFNSYELGANNLNIVKIIQNAIEDGAEVTVVGYTDRIGDENANKKLSKNRALAASSSILNQEIKEDKSTPVNNYNTNLVVDRRSVQYADENGNVKNVILTIKGEGESQPYLYSNDLPEGRYYCRTVVIEVKKKR